MRQPKNQLSAVVAVLFVALFLYSLMIRGADAIPWPVNVPSNDTSIGGNYLDYRSRLAGGQPPGEKGTFHHAVDIIAPEGEPVRAVADGFVEAGQDQPIEGTTRTRRLMFRGNLNRYYHRLDIADDSAGLGGPLWAYMHTTYLGRDGNPRKPWVVGDAVTVGQVIGQVAKPSSDVGFGFKANPHVHLSRRTYPGLTYWEWDAVGVENPLALLDGYTDSNPPRIPGGDGGISELKFRRNEPDGTYIEKSGHWWDPPSTRSYTLDGKVDVIANIDDWTPPSWKAEAGPHLVGYQLVRANWDSSSFEVHPEIVTFEAVGQAPTNDLLDVIYEFGPSFWPFDGSAETTSKRFIYIVTNTASDPDSVAHQPLIRAWDRAECWDTTRYPDGNHMIRVFADDIAGNRTGYLTPSKWITVHNEGGTTVKAEVTHKTETGERQDTTLIVYQAEWENGQLDVSEDEFCEPQQNDSVFVDLWFSEPMYPDSIVVELMGDEPTPTFSVAELSWETEVFGDDHWRGYIPTVAWEAMRNRLKGERRLRILAWDLAGAMLDTDPSTYAHIDTTSGEWEGFEDDNGAPSDSGGHDQVHSFSIAPFRDLCLAVDASSSMNLSGWELSQLRVFQHLIDWMKTEEGGGEDYRVAAWRFWSTVDQLADYSDDLDDAWSSLGLYAGPQGVGAHEPGQYDPAHPFGGYMPMTDVENPLLVAMQYAMAEYDDPKVVCVVSDFWQNLGCTIPELESRCHWIAEQGPIFLLANEGALYGSECSEELKEAARISGGGYLEGYGSASVESLYHAIPPVFESRGVLAQVDCAGSDTVSMGVDSTMTRLDVIVSLSSWSGAAILREREEGKERSRGTYQLRDQGGSLVTPTYYGSGLYKWAVEDPQVGAWQLEVIADPTEEYSMIARAGSPIELRLLSTGSIAEGATDTIEVKLEWERLENEEFELVDQNGEAVATLTLNEERIRVYSGLYTFSEGGHFRVRIRGDLGTQVVERETELCLNVRAAPTIELISPASGETEIAGTSYTIEWIDSCPERNASVTIGYDENDVYSGSEEIIATVEEAGADTGHVIWDVFSVPEGTYFVWICIDDSLNNPVRVYGGQVTVTKGYQEGWPVTLGGDIEKNLCLSDLDNNGTVEVIVGAKDSLLYVLNYDGTNYGVNWPFNCHGMLTSGAAVGDVDGDGEKEIVAVCSDTALVWVLNADGVVESGWPQTMRSGTWSAPLLVDLTGDGIPEIAAAGYDSTLWAWDGFGAALSGNWPVGLAHINQNSSPAGGDIDQDGENEVVVSSRYGSSGAKVYAIEADGSIKWEYEVDYPVWTSPAIADVDGDGKKEIMFTTFGFLANTSRLFVLNGEDGSEASGWIGGNLIDKWAESSPAVGYLDQSGSPGIVIADGTGEVEAWNGSGTRLWNRTVSGYAIKSDPLIVDLTGDQTMEVVVGANHRVYTLNAVTGDTISAYSRGTESDTRSVAVGDLDGDGDLEIIATVFSGVIYAWDLPGSAWSDGQEWPQLQRDEAKTGEYRESASPAAPELLDAEFVSPDSMRVTWQTVAEDVYGRDELVKKYVIYRDDEPYGVDGSTLAGEVGAPDTSFTEQSAAVGDPNQGVFYRVKAEDQYGNRSDLSDGTVGEVDFGTGGPGKRRDREKRGKPIAR